MSKGTVCEIFFFLSTRLQEEWDLLRKPYMEWLVSTNNCIELRYSMSDFLMMISVLSGAVFFRHLMC